MQIPNNYVFFFFVDKILGRKILDLARNLRRAIGRVKARDTLDAVLPGNQGFPKKPPDRCRSAK
jgi:hypothetical protein